MRTCHKCNKEQDNSNFAPRKDSKDGLAYWCRSCCREQNTKWRHKTGYNKKYWLANIEKIRDANRNRYRLNKDSINKQRRDSKREIKQELVNMLGGKCSRCGYNKCLSALDFHHKDPNIKDFRISDHLYRGKINIEELKQEVLKCDLLCKNCHSEEHDLLL